MQPKIEISVVVPVYNEALNLVEFFSELNGVMEAYGKSFEVIFVDDGSTDESKEVLVSLAERNSYTQIITLRRNIGKAGALEHGFRLAKGDKVIIIDCDLQYDPRDIPALIDKIEEGYDIVSGRRVKRADSGEVVLTSRLFRLIVSRLSGLNFKDYFSGIKGFRSSVLDYLGSYGDLNRTFTVYAYHDGYKVCELPVTHRPRGHGKSKYTFLKRLRLAVFDVIVLFYIVTVSRERLYKIGLLGIANLSCGSIMTVASLLLSTDLTAADFFGSGLTRAGILFIYLGWQLRIIEVVGKEFIWRHGRAYNLRARNVKEVYNASGEELNMILGDKIAPLEDRRDY